MSLLIDASSPVLVSGAGPGLTTASFTPPAGSILLVQTVLNATSGTNPTQPVVTDSAGLTYTLVQFASHADVSAADGQAAVWWARVPSSAAMTVTVTNQAAVGHQSGALLVQVITGADTVSPILLSGKIGRKTAGNIAQAYTALSSTAQGFLVAADWDANVDFTAGTGTSGSFGVATGSGNVRYGFARRTVEDDSAGVSNTINLTSITDANFNWVWFEVGEPAAVSPSFGTYSGVGLGQTPGSLAWPWTGTDSQATADHVVVLGQATETDLAQPVTPVVAPWTVVLGQPVETDLAQPVTPVVAPWTVVLGQPSEQDDAQPVGSIRGVADPDPKSSLWIVSPAAPFGPPGAGPDPWFGVDIHDVPVALGQAQETDLAQPVTVVQGPAHTVTLGQPTETDVAQPVVAVDAPTTVTLGQCTETDLAQPLTASHAAGVGQAVEAETAQPMGQLHAYPDADPGSGLTFAAPGLYGAPGSVASPWQGDLAAAVTGQLVGIGQAAETDLAQPVTVIHPWTVIIGQTTEIDLAQSVVAINTHVVLIGQTVETDLAQTLTVIHQLIVLLGQAAETDLAQAVTVHLVASTVPASLSSLASGAALSSGTGGAALSSRTGAQNNDVSQSTDMLSSTDTAAGGLSGV